MTRRRKRIISAGQSHSTSKSSVGNYITRQNNNDYYGSINFRYYPTELLTFRTGVTYDERSVGTKGQFPIKIYALNDTSRFYEDTVKISRKLLETYLYTKVNLKRLVASIGIRKNIPIEQVKNYMSFQGNVRYNFNSAQFINISAGQYNSYVTPSPSLFDFIHYKTSQLALDWSYQKMSSQFDISFYMKKEEGLFPSSSKGAEFHVNHSLFRIINVDLSFSTIHSKTNYNYTNYYYRTFYVPSSYNMPFSIKNLIRINLNWVNVGIYTLYRSGAPYTPVASSSFDSYAGYYYPHYLTTPNSATLPAYFRTDINFSKLLGKQPVDKKWILFLNINNLFNSLNVRSYVYNFDYTSRTNQFFQKRFLYFGFMKKF